MAEIIIAIIINLSTLLGGTPSETQKTKDTDDQKGKNKTEHDVSKSGGSGGYQEGG